jgi:DNA-binding transcriptional regulator YdaS (Cro superfamily)
MERQINRYTNGQISCQAGRREIDRKTERWTDKERNNEAVKQTDEHVG